MREEIQPVLPVDLAREILEVPPNYRDAAEKTKVEALINALNQDALETAARTSYTYWVVSATRAKAIATGASSPYEGFFAAVTTDSNIEEMRRNMAEHAALAHLRAEKGSLERARTRLDSYIQLRKELNLDLIRSCFIQPSLCAYETSQALEERYREMVRYEMEHGQNVALMGHDSQMRPITLRGPRMAPPRDEETALVANYYSLERSLACAEVLSRGRSLKVVSALDYTGTVSAHALYTSTLLKLVRNLDLCYPERLHRLIIIDPPFYYRAAWSMICMFLAQETQDKIVMLNTTDGREKNDAIVEQCLDIQYATPTMHSKGEMVFEYSIERYLEEIPTHQYYYEEGDEIEYQ